MPKQEWFVNGRRVMVKERGDAPEVGSLHAIYERRSRGPIWNVEVVGVERGADGSVKVQAAMLLRQEPPPEV